MVIYDVVCIYGTKVDSYHWVLGVFLFFPSQAERTSEKDDHIKGKKRKFIIIDCFFLFLKEYFVSGGYL